ncbi:MAG: NAD-dependent epimerase/dehydratase family protein [Sphingomonadaceae bacterium]
MDDSAPASVLVTGGCGFLGSVLVSRLVKKHHNVTVLDDLSAGDARNVPSDVKLLVGCATDRAAMREAVAGADIIFHLASVVGQLRVHQDPAWAIHVSEASTEIILEEAPGVPLILFSSSAVYGLETSGLCSESLDISQDTAVAYDGQMPGYAAGKWRAERIAQHAQRSPVLTLRPFNAIGPGQLGSYGMVLPRFIDWVRKGEPLRIYGDGLQARCFSASWVMIDSILKLVDSWLAGETEHSVFNVGSNVETTILELAEAVERICGGVTSRQFVPFDDVYPGKLDVLRRVPCTKRLEEAVGRIDWPSVDEIVLQIIGGRYSHGNRLSAVSGNRLPA